jgi:hypothetical protein
MRGSSVLVDEASLPDPFDFNAFCIDPHEITATETNDDDSLSVLHKPVELH